MMILRKLKKLSFRDNRRLLQAQLLAGLLVVLSMAIIKCSYADMIPYGQPLRTIYAGTIAPEGASALVPNTFNVFNRRTDVRPIGWTLDNPYAVHFDSSNKPVTIDDGLYWTVNLSSLSQDDINKYQVLLLEVNDADSNLTVDNVNKLRRWVDCGGTLWIDTNPSVNSSASMLTRFENWFSPTVDGTRSPITYPTILGTDIYNPGATILRMPYDLVNGYDIYQLGAAFGGVGNITLSGMNSFFMETTGSFLRIGKLGAGQVVFTATGSALNINNTYVNNGNRYQSLADLKLMANIIALSDLSSSALNNRQPIGTADDMLGASVLPGWYLNIPAPAASTYGLYTYIVDSSSNYWLVKSSPSKNNGNTNTAAAINISAITSPFSPPTIVGGANGFNRPFVTLGNGTVYDINSKAALNSGTSGNYLATMMMPPSPAYYNNKLYATQPDGTLFIYNLNTVNGYNYKASKQIFDTGNEQGAGTPLVTEKQYDNGNVVSLLYTTNKALYNVMTGVRSDKVYLQPAGFDTDGSHRFYNTLMKLWSYHTTLPAQNIAQIDDKSSVISLYSLDINQKAKPLPSSLYSDNQEFSTPDIGAQNVFADYDVNFNISPAANAYNAYTVSIVGVLGNPIDITNGTTDNVATYVSSPVIDKKGYTYFTVNYDKLKDNSIFCVNDSGSLTLPEIKWRFRLPNSNDDDFTDADGQSYKNTELKDSYFVGSPAVGADGFVYALATNGTSSFVLSFDTSKSIYGNVPVIKTALGDPISISMNQPLNIPYASLNTAGSANNEFGGPVTITYLNNNGSKRFTTDSGSGKITLNYFGSIFGSVSPAAICPDLCEPMPVVVTYTLVGGESSFLYYAMPLHTNLNWIARLNNSNPTASPAVVDPGFKALVGLVSSGKYLYTVGQSNKDNKYHLYRISADVQGTTSNGPKYYSTIEGNDSNGKPCLTDLGDMFVDVPTEISENQGNIIVTGASGISVYNPITTVICDTNRIVALDADGDAIFSVDATKSYPTLGLGASSNPYAAPVAKTIMPLNHPTSLKILDSGGYLVADTGNNRCVELMPDGSVIWELNTFSLGSNNANIPTTLNEPTGVDTWMYTDTATNIAYKVYLISDTGNNRIIAVQDQYTQTSGSNNVNRVLPTHTLRWVTQPSAQKYRYSSAFRYIKSISVSGVPTYAYAAIITNSRLAADNSSQGPGGCIVLLDDTGNITDYINDVPKNGKLVPLKNPKYLASYTPAVANASGCDNLLIADDNGVYDITPPWSSSTSTPAPIVTNWMMDTSEFHKINTPIKWDPIKLVQAPFDRTNIPFNPVSVRRIGSDIVGMNVYGRYLITNGVSQAIAGLPDGYNGEAFIYSAALNNVINTRTFSNPTNAAPLMQPNCAMLAR